MSRSPSLSPQESFESSEFSASTSSGLSADSRSGISSASVEQGRGSGFLIPPEVLQRRELRHEAQSEETDEDEEILFAEELYRRMRQPMDARRRIPGCGINHFNPREEDAVCAFTDPVDREALFGCTPRTYDRFKPMPRKRIVGRSIQPSLSSYSSSVSDFQPIAVSSPLSSVLPMTTRGRVTPRYVPSPESSPGGHSPYRSPRYQNGNTQSYNYSPSLGGQSPYRSPGYQNGNTQSYSQSSPSGLSVLFPSPECNNAKQLPPTRPEKNYTSSPVHSFESFRRRQLNFD